MTILHIREYFTLLSHGIRSRKARHHLKNALQDLLKFNVQPILQLLLRFIAIHSSGLWLNPKTMTKAFLSDLDLPLAKKLERLSIPKLTIVVPIYGNLEALSDLISDLEVQTHRRLHILLIDDGSNNKQLDILLSEIQTKPRFTVLKNKKNIGYTSTINRAIFQTNSDLILLNTDTRVTQDFAERIHIKLRENPRYATVSPLSNAASICSIPEVTNESQLKSVTDEAMAKINTLLHNLKLKLDVQDVEIPTAVGFAMAIKREALNQVGTYNEKEFSPGYGEEVEWCLRASFQGWLHILEPSIFVYHSSGSSFGDAKARLVEEHSNIIRERFPKFESEVSSFLLNDPLLEYRWISYIYLRKYIGNPLTLVVRHQKGGGSGSWSLNSAQKSDCVELTFANRPILQFNGEKKSYKVELSIDTIISLINKDLFDHIEIGSLPFNVIQTEINFTKCLNEIVQRLSSNIKVITVIHDYYSICPSYTLIDFESKFCDIPSVEVCKLCLLKNSHIEISNRKFTITEWRSIFQKIFLRSDKIVFLSKNSEKYISRVFQIIPEKIDYFDPFNLSKIEKHPHILANGSKKKVLILGNINYAKGSEIVRKLALLPLFQEGNESLYLLGKYTGELPESVTDLGAYESKTLENLLREIGPDLVVIPSIWPETYCFTAEEAWSLGYRVAFFDIGALPERFLDREHAYKLSYPYSEKTSAELENILRGSDDAE